MRATWGLILATAFAAMAGLAGCATVASVGPEPSLIQPAATRAGSVYLLRGFMGITGGIDELRDELGRLGLRTVAYNPERWRDVAAAIIAQRKAHPGSGPIILVGFSAGAGDAVRVSRALGNAGIPVDLLVSLDPSSPLDLLSPRVVPANVARALNLYQTRTVLHGMPLTAAEGFRGQLTNENLDHIPDMGHPDFVKRPAVRERVLARILEVAPPRQPASASCGTKALLGSPS